MTKNKNGQIPTPEELGIPSGSFDPMKTLKAEFNFYDLAPRSRLMKILFVLFIFVFFILPPIFITYISVFLDPPESDEIIAFIFILFLCLLYFLAGTRTIYRILNSKKFH